MQEIWNVSVFGGFSSQGSSTKIVSRCLGDPPPGYYGGLKFGWLQSEGEIVKTGTPPSYVDEDTCVPLRQILHVSPKE